MITDPEQKARCVLGLGGLIETAKDYDAAVRYYRAGLGLEPTNPNTWYFINNNLAFNLNTLGRFAEGEQFCRTALNVNPNARVHTRTWGIALAGQGDYRSAAEAFVAATRANAADPRSVKHLQELLMAHPELEYEYAEQLKACQNAVAAFGKEREKHRSVVYRGWRKQLILAKVSKLINRLNGAFNHRI